MPLFPRDDWALLSHLLIFHGRQICIARRPRCGDCVLADSVRPRPSKLSLGKEFAVWAVGRHDFCRIPASILPSALPIPGRDERRWRSCQHLAAQRVSVPLSVA